MKTQADVVVLCSGGLDSTLLIHWAKKLKLRPIALLIEYGQRHIRELEKAKETCDRLSVPFTTMTVDLGGAVDSALTGAMVGGRYQGVSEWHVPGRNVIFAGLALSLAESVGARRIWYGANYEDRLNHFPDCYQEWVYQMSLVLQRSASYPVEIEAPLLGMRKDVIKALAESEGIKEEDVHSGYSA